MPPKGHALLSASSSHRWLNCPPSARLCENYDDKGSDFAAEGTDAHALCEFRLQEALGIEAVNPIENLTWYNEELEDCATAYASYVLELVEETTEGGLFLLLTKTVFAVFGLQIGDLGRGQT